MEVSPQHQGRKRGILRELCQGTLEEGMATHSSVLAWRIPTDRGAWWAVVHRVAESDMTERLSTHTHTGQGNWMNSLVAPHPLPWPASPVEGGRSAASARLIPGGLRRSSCHRPLFFPFHNDESELVHSCISPKHSRNSYMRTARRQE